MVNNTSETLHLHPQTARNFDTSLDVILILIDKTKEYRRKLYVVGLSFVPAETCRLNVMDSMCIQERRHAWEVSDFARWHVLTILTVYCVKSTTN
jgi:hypothetical protein